MQEPPKGYFTATYVSEIDHSVQPFALWVPPSYNARKKYALMVALHGSDADERMIPEECFRIPSRGFHPEIIALFPFGRGDLDYRWMGEADLWDTMEWVKSLYRIDDRRQYLTGLSMGGFATWRLAMEYPDQWAAIAPVCGGGEITKLDRMAAVPVWCVHGEADPIVPVEYSRAMVGALIRLHGECRYSELRGWGHRAWEWLYDPERADGGLANWFLEHRRKSPPQAQLRPIRESSFMDLFNEPLVVSYATGGVLGREAELLRREADRVASFTHGDYSMRSGRLIVKPDHDLTRDDLRHYNHLMIGRSDNHRWLKFAERKLVARHRKGVLTVGKETYLGKSLLVLARQPSPWNKKRLLGIASYQQFQQMRLLLNALLDEPLGLKNVNVFDAQPKRFIRRES